MNKDKCPSNQQPKRETRPQQGNKDMHHGQKPQQPSGRPNK